MTIEDKKRELVLNRIQQAEESLEEAEYLFDGNKSPRRGQAIPTREQVAPYLDRAKNFINAVKDYIEDYGRL